MSIQKILINTDLTDEQFKSVCDISQDRYLGLKNLANYLLSVAGGIRSASISVFQGGVAASASITLTGLPIAAETITVGTQTFTAVASGAGADEFNIGATADETALNLANAINADSALGPVLTATPNAGVITLTCKDIGDEGNAIALTSTLTNVAVVGFANGTDGIETTL